MEQQLKDQLNQTINVKSVSAINQHGEVTLGSATEVSARVVRESDIVMTSSGKEVKTTHSIVCEDALLADDRIWLPGDSASTAKLGREIKELIIAIDKDGDVDYYLAKV